MTDVVPTACRHEGCFAPETACILGKVPCEHFGEAATAPASEITSGPPLPWSGLSLGLADLVAVAATGPVRLIALIGVAGAGKTTVLAAHWIAARRGAGAYGAAFAGSYTLAGWQQIARHLQWVPFGSGGFPPHTSASTNRSPALLHFSLRIDSGFVNLLYTDVPGEWYRAWAYDADGVPAVTWIADNADAFVVLADSEALSGPERGRARGDYDALAARVASIARGRPVVPILTKSDVDVPRPLRDHLDDRNRALFGVDTTAVSVHERAHAPITAAVDLGVRAALPAQSVTLAAVSRARDPLLAFRSPAAERV